MRTQCCASWMSGWPRFWRGACVRMPRRGGGLGLAGGPGEAPGAAGAAGATGPGYPAGARPPQAQSAAPGASGSADSGRASYAGGAGGAGGPRPGGSGDLQQLLERSPQLSLADLKKGDALIISSSKGADGSSMTAFSLVAG